ncbi:hypothetical protein [Pelagibacterium halotolerans]|uniref:Uncharacterized protein n=1 Tax=Pelagibacterium halotolerans (strain DSM 22347 / JCM 15775 / CGMCC 1.7692 / B2) TaxID=1082931 RepID=G4RBI0_PELHB|nr:hypothetical protein [Pelagibacterium halotolerans]AEQ52656.1 hypothetical protein KKY_2648 [Pelagibacterium halotolerans B2]QJR17642.1 hypothetical protein HKM20_03810 [Pelagibacterium halotolerans]SEA83915.1 hypothetical protein SAMN05428936_10950 [Pelagibacterium halotolerans]
MPRTHAETMAIAELAQEVGYEHPPANLEPTGLMCEDPTWNDLVNFFRENTDSWQDAIRVYCATRFDHSLDQVTMNANSWFVSVSKRLELDDDPEAIVNFNEGGMD